MPAVAVTLAWPSASVTAGEPVRVAEAPDAGASEGDAGAGHRVAEGILDHRHQRRANPVATVAVWPDPETTATDAGSGRVGQGEAGRSRPRPPWRSTVYGRPWRWPWR